MELVFFPLPNSNALTDSSKSLHVVIRVTTVLTRLKQSSKAEETFFLTGEIRIH
jgi:hypothetical protein